jgi:hypothetical protein
MSKSCYQNPLDILFFSHERVGGTEILLSCTRKKEQWFHLYFTHSCTQIVAELGRVLISYLSHLKSLVPNTWTAFRRSEIRFGRERALNKQILKPNLSLRRCVILFYFLVRFVDDWIHTRLLLFHLYTIKVCTPGTLTIPSIRSFTFHQQN